MPLAGAILKGRLSLQTLPRATSATSELCARSSTCPTIAVTLTQNKQNLRLLTAMIVSASLAQSGVALLKHYVPTMQPKNPSCRPTVSLRVAGAVREVPLEVFMGNSCIYGTDGVSVMMVP
jgi:hypothetical protein